MENTTLHTDWASAMALDIAMARSSVLITSLSLQTAETCPGHPLGMLWAAMHEAAQRGAAITFILPQPARSHPATAYNIHAGYALQAAGVRVIYAPTGNLLHAKTVTIDESIVWVGSGNWTKAAAAWNHEAYVRCQCPALAVRMANYWREKFGK